MHSTVCDCENVRICLSRRGRVCVWTLQQKEREREREIPYWIISAQMQTLDMSIIPLHKITNINIQIFKLIIIIIIIITIINIIQSIAYISIMLIMINSIRDVCVVTNEQLKQLSSTIAWVDQPSNHQYYNNHNDNNAMMNVICPLHFNIYLIV